MNENALLGMVGLARRAGRIALGRTAVEKALSGHKAEAVLLDGDASQNTLKDISAMCSKAGVKLLILPGGSLEELLGEGRRCAAVTDINFAKQIIKLYEQA